MKNIKWIAMLILLVIAIVAFYIVYQANSKVKTSEDCATCGIEQSE